MGRGVKLFFLFLLLSLAFYWRIPILGEAPLFGDVAVQFLPWKILVKRALISGQIPLWNPYSMAGKPFLANMQSAVLYPVDLLMLWLPIRQFYAWSLLVHTALAGCFTYLLARRMRVSPAGSLFAAIAFMFNGFFAIHLFAGNLLTIISSCWIPAVFLAAHRLADSLTPLNKGGRGDFSFPEPLKTKSPLPPLLRGVKEEEDPQSRRPFLLSAPIALAFAIQILSGHPQMTFYTVFFATVWVLVATRAGGRVLWHWALGLILAGCLTAAQLLPTVELAFHSSRSELTFEQATEFSFSLGGLIGLFIPEFFGTHAQGSFWNNWYYWSSAYVGIWTVLFAVLFILRRVHVRFFRWGSSSYTPDYFWAWLVVLFLSFFLAMGRQNPVYHWVFSLPFFSSFRAPAKFLPFAVLALCLLGGLGVDRFLERVGGVFRSPQRANYFWAFGSFIALVLLIWPFHGDPRLPDGESKTLFAMSQSFMNAGVYLVVGLVVIWLGVRGALSRYFFALLLLLMVFSDLWNFGAKYQTLSNPEQIYEKTKDIELLKRDPDWFRIATMKDVFYPEAFCVFELENICGYDPLSLATYARKFKESQGEAETSFRDDFNLGQVSGGLLEDFNVKYLLTQQVLDSSKFKEVLLGERFRIYQNLDWTPRLAVLNTLALRTSKGLNEFSFRARSEADSVVSLSQLAYPGWKALIDEKPTPISTSKDGLVSLKIPAGEHRIRLIYRPLSFIVGVMISLFSSLFLLLEALAKLRIRRSREEPAPSEGGGGNPAASNSPHVEGLDSRLRGNDG